MSANPGTYTPFLNVSGGSVLAARWRRERVGRALVLGGATVVLAALLVIPIFLITSILPWTPLPSGAWSGLGVLLAGTFKAGFCALLVALPLGIAAAIFSAEFSAPAFRSWFKPALEILEAIPTVVLGLIAFATLSPWLGANVGTLLALMVALPALLIAAGMAFGARLRRLSGWLPLWLLPALIAVVAVIVALVGPHQMDLIVPVSPWNAVLVGLALGLAAVPLVFSIAEDALMLIPATHVQAAFALGATRWQALKSIVLPAARPGIVAAMALGASRCLGETMIVLMASGNTPLPDLNPLTGLRTISAELAVGLPEAAAPGGAYRTLLLAALVLFALTFVLNLLAERARARMHRRADRANSPA
ncbi:MAG TPA: ABC transporter permease subunit [Rhodanobacteraceae bacterium]|jgi:phosphate transport system permease protein|nr:ABC transporter permease subunit [Rhodanobacteraceae bacterium]